MLAVLLTERGLGGNDGDLADRLRRFRSDRSPRAEAARGLARRIAETATKAAGEADLAAAETGGEPGAMLALAYPDRVAMARGARGSFVLANGRGGVLDETAALARERAIVVAELQGQARAGRILSAAALSAEAMERILDARGVSEDVVVFDRQSRAVRARRVTRLGRAVLSETPLPTPSGPEAERALIEGIRSLGLGVLPFGKEGERLLRRLRFLAKAYGSPWPDLSEEALLAGLEDWLAPYVPGAASSCRHRCRADRTGAARARPGGSAWPDRTARTLAFRRAIGLARADPLRGGPAGSVDPGTGTLRPHRTSGDRGRPASADCGTPVSGAPADPDHTGPAGLLGGLLVGRAGGSEGPLSQACLAGGPCQCGGDGAGETAKVAGGGSEGADLPTAGRADGPIMGAGRARCRPCSIATPLTANENGRRNARRPQYIHV